MDDLDRLYTRLVSALRERGGGSDTHACAIAELYQNLVPYRAVRTELGFAELPRYEHALLRLLSGERSYLSVDLPKVRDEIRAELRSPNPILGVYRDYAAVGVRVRLNGTVPETVAPELDRTVEAPVGPRRERPAADRATARPAAPLPSAEPAPPPRAAERCPQCDRQLPGGRAASFCPSCGVALKPVPCAECGEVVESAWNFCIHCGAPDPAERRRRRPD